MKKIVALALSFLMIASLLTVNVGAANRIVLEPDFSEGVATGFKVSGGVIEDGVFTSHKVNTLYRLDYIGKMGETGTHKIYFDYLCDTEIKGEVMTMFLGLRRKNETAIGNAKDGLWIAMKNGNVGMMVDKFPQVQYVETGLTTADFTRMYFEDSPETGEIKIYMDNNKTNKKKQLVATVEIEIGAETTTVKMYGAKKEDGVKITSNLPYALAKSGYTCWWSHCAEEIKVKDIYLEYDEYERPKYYAADPLAYNDALTDTWVATDDLGRTTPTSEEAGSPRDVKVGMFYYLWNTGGTARDVNKAYNEGGLDAVWEILRNGGDHHYWWGEPYFGYYNMVVDEWVLRKHATMLSNAGIDYVFFDNTNGVTFSSSYMALCQAWAKMRREGLATPQIVFFMGDDYNTTTENYYEYLYRDGYYCDLWFEWDGKPLIMSKTGNIPEKYKDFFTVRESWAFNSGVNEGGLYQWQWNQEYPQIPGVDEKGNIEQVGVSVGGHPVNTRKEFAIGRSWHNDAPGNMEKEDFGFSLMETTTPLGLHYEEQWSRVFELSPKMVTITSWNEWQAGRKTDYMPGSWFANTYQVQYKNPDYNAFFVDQFNPEFSRDAEPMKGGFGDNYYWQTVQNVRQFKGVRDIPAAEGDKTIDIGGSLDQWDDVWPEYKDHVGDITHRNAPGSNSITYVNKTGRNDIDIAKVANDENYWYFYVKCAKDITAPEGTNWMNLYIDADRKFDTGWKGYDFIINRVQKSGYASVEAHNVDYKWKTLGKAAYTVQGDVLQIRVAKSLVNIDEATGFDFKWADNSTSTGEAMEFLDLGDCGPDDRFNFRYTKKQAEVKINSVTDGVVMKVNRNVGLIDGKLTKVDAANTNVTPFVYEGTTLVPVRFLAESLGAKVGWNDRTNTVTITKSADNTKDIVITLVIGEKTMTVNGQMVEIPMEAKVFDNRTFLPLRTIAEAMNKIVSWDERGIIVVSDAEATAETMNEIWIKL